MEAPETWVRSTIICACRSVAKPGKGSVETSAPAERGRVYDPRPDAGGAREGLDLHAHPAQLVELHLEVRGVRVLDEHVPAGRGGGHQEGAGLDAVRHHRPLDGLEPLHALDDDAARAGAHHARAHRVQHVGDGDDLGLPGRVLDDRDALGQHGGHHHVLGGPDARVLEDDLRALQAPRRGRLDKAVVELDVGSRAA
jgi:hypothetical protein